MKVFPRTNCGCVLMILYLAVTLMTACPVAARASASQDPVSVLEHAQAAIAANRSAARSVILRGTLTAVGEFVERGTGTDRVRREPYSKSHAFTFTGDQFGELRRWETPYERPKYKNRDRLVLTHGIVLDVSKDDHGYVRTRDEFLPERADNIDFYRDHWFSGASIEDVVRYFQKARDTSGVQTAADGTTGLFSAPGEPPTIWIDTENSFLLARLTSPRFLGL